MNSETLLTPDSPQISDLCFSQIPLWQHQKAMVSKCMDIEQIHCADVEGSLLVPLTPTNIDRYKEKPNNSIQSVHVGVMNDPPGSGKTYATLALMAMDRTPTLNMVIVPPNLHHQWIDAIDTFFGGDKNIFKVLKVCEYQDTNSLWRSNKVFDDIRLVITTSEFSEPVASALNFLSTVLETPTIIERVIIDEVDTTTTLMHTIPTCKRVWLMSASFNPLIHKNIGQFDLSGISNEDINKLICRCDRSFIEQSINLEEPLSTVVTVPDGDISLFLNGVLVDNNDILLLNALNFKRFKGKNSHYVSPNDTNNMFEYAVMYRDALQKELKALLDLDDDFIDDDVQMRIDGLQERISAIQRNMEYRNPGKHQTKLDVIGSICIQRILPSTKWIFFSDDDALFDLIGPMLTQYGISFVTMSEGSREKAKEAIMRYKTDPSIRVLFINSMRDGCGLNLENTTHVLFLHETNAYLYEQVIGRAQRPGRTCRLNVISILHENESKNSNI